MSLQEEKFDKEYKKALFENISQFSSTIAQNTNLIEQSYQYTNINAKLPNIATNLNNKLVLDIFPRFKKSDLYFGSTSSILGECIIFDLIDRATNGVQALEDYSSNLNLTNSTALAKISPVRNFISKLKVFITGDIFSKEQLKKANMNLKEYKDSAKSIYNYSLDTDLPISILSYFKDNHFPKDIVLELLEDDINPNMEKLELSHLIPELKNKILTDKEYNKSEFLNTLKASSKTITKKSIFKSNKQSDKDDLSK